MKILLKIYSKLKKIIKKKIHSSNTLITKLRNELLIMFKIMFKFNFLVYFSLQILILIIFTTFSGYDLYFKKNTYKISYDFVLEKKYYQDMFIYQNAKLFNSPENIDRLKKSIDDDSIIIKSIISKIHIDPFEKENFPYLLYKNYQFSFTSLEKIDQDFLNQKTYDNINLIIDDLFNLYLAKNISDNSTAKYYNLKKNELCSNIKVDLTNREAVNSACIQEIIEFSKSRGEKIDNLIPKAFNNLRKFNEKYTFPDQKELYKKIVEEKNFKDDIREQIKNNFKNKIKIKKVNSFLSSGRPNHTYIYMVLIFVILINIIYILNIKNKKRSI